MAKAVLRIKGIKSFYNGIVSNIWAAAAHTEGHITAQMEKFMGTLSQSVTDLSTAIAREFDDIRAAAEATLADLREQVEAVGSENVELKEALEAQVATSEDYLQQINDAQARIDALVAELGANDPEEPVDPDAPHPDHTLPGDLPGAGDHVDNSLPGDQPQVNPLRGGKGRK